MPRVNTPSFLNLTGELDDDQAKSVVSKLTELVIQAEQDRSSGLSRAEEAIRIYKNQLWDEDDRTYFQEKFNVDPYQIPAARAPLNRLVAQQRGMQYDFGIVPIDQFSYDRYRRGRAEFIESRGEEFGTEDQAGEYYDRYYDDEFSATIEVALTNNRIKQKTKQVEAQAFENAVITGLDFLKTTYSYQNNPDGELKTERKSVRQMLWDHGSVLPTLEDVEFIGEVTLLYKQDLIASFPDHVQEIERVFEDYSNFQRGTTTSQTSRWRDYYSFDTNRNQVKLKVVELWYQDYEERYQLVDNETQSPRLIKYGLDEDQIWEYVLESELDELVTMMERGELDPSFFARSPEEIRSDIDSEVREKYSLRTTQAKVFYKAVFTHNALLEFKRNPLPTNSHPYTPIYAQFTDGIYTGVIDDIKDIVLAYNKAFMFREIMLANSAKGLLVVDKGSLARDGWTVDDIREAWTEIGGVIDLELRGGRRLGDVFQNITTVGDGLVEIRSILNDLEAKMFNIIGINNAMLGNVSGEAPASQVRQAIQQGQTTNAVIFDNFNSAVQNHVHDKVIPIIIADLMMKKPQSLNVLSDARQKWIELNYNEDFELFVDAMVSGQYQTKLTIKEPDKQISAQQSAMLMQLAMSRPDAIDIEAAIEFSDLEYKGAFLRRNRELLHRRHVDTNLRMVGLQSVAELMAEYGIDAETADKMVRDLQKQRVNELRGSGESNQLAQGNGTIQRLSAEPSRQADIEQANIIQN